MIAYIKSQIITTLCILATMTLVCGVIYPSSIYCIAQLVYPWQANGSLIVDNGWIVGSNLIGQNFESNKYFWSRPSATLPVPYNAENSCGSNLSPNNPVLIDKIQQRIKRIHATHNIPDSTIPMDLLTSSASGLDPHISLRSAIYQAQRVSNNRNVEVKKVIDLINSLVEGNSLGIFSAPRINVLQLNLHLDRLHEQEVIHG